MAIAKRLFCSRYQFDRDDSVQPAEQTTKLAETLFTMATQRAGPCKYWEAALLMIIICTRYRSAGIQLVHTGRGASRNLFHNLIDQVLTVVVTSSYSRCKRASPNPLSSPNELNGETLKRIKQIDQDICLGFWIREDFPELLQQAVRREVWFSPAVADSGWLTVLLQRDGRRVLNPLLKIEAAGVNMTVVVHLLAVRPGPSLDIQIANRLFLKLAEEYRTLSMFPRQILERLRYNAILFREKGSNTAHSLIQLLETHYSVGQSSTSTKHPRDPESWRALDTAQVEDLVAEKRSRRLETLSSMRVDSSSRMGGVLGKQFSQEVVHRTRHSEECEPLLEVGSLGSTISAFLWVGTRQDQLFLVIELLVRHNLDLIREVGGRLITSVAANAKIGSLLWAFLHSIADGDAKEEDRLKLVESYHLPPKDMNANIEAGFENHIRKVANLTVGLRGSLYLRAPDSIEPLESAEFHSIIANVDLCILGRYYEGFTERCRSVWFVNISLIPLTQHLDTISEELKSLLMKHPLIGMRLMSLLTEPARVLLRFQSTNDLRQTPGRFSLIEMIHNLLDSLPPPLNQDSEAFLLETMNYLLAERRSENGIPETLRSIARANLSLVRKSSLVLPASTMKRLESLEMALAQKSSSGQDSLLSLIRSFLGSRDQRT